VTEWLARLGERLTRPSLPFSDETRRLIQKYAPPAPERDREVREATLIAAHAVLLIPAIALWGVAAWLASTTGSHAAWEVAFWVGCALIAAWVAGLWLHTLRYYDALVARRRSERRTGPGGEPPAPRRHRWPRTSSDADFVLELGVSLGLLVLVALR
jgi:hypothetical protein